jgi:hypothetical protein
MERRRKDNRSLVSEKESLEEGVRMERGGLGELMAKGIEGVK